MKTGFLPAILAYVAVVGAVGLRASRRSRGAGGAGDEAGLDSFFLASRALGPARLAFTLCASWIGAASLLVTTDQAARDGAGAAWIVGVPAVVTLLVLTALAGPIRATSGLTLPELMRARYGRAAGALTTVLVAWYMTALAASQLVAAGPFLGAFLGTGPAAGAIAAVALVAVYGAAGGLRAVARTHVVQFGLLVAGVAGMAAYLAARVPWAAVEAAAAGLGKTSYFDLLAGGSRGPLVAASFVLAWTVSPIAWQRTQAARSDGAARAGLASSAVLLGLFYAGIVAVGMRFLPFFPDGPSDVPMVTRFAASAAGPLLGGLVFATVLAAILSTTDAALNAGSFALTKDLLGRRRRPLLLARLTSLGLAAAALIIALRLEDILVTLGLASTIMAEGLLVPGLAALFLRARAPRAGLLSLLLGGGHATVCFLAEAGLVPLSVPPWPRTLPMGVALGAGGFLAGLALGKIRTRPSRPVPAAGPDA